jgi:hypothetical protein
MLAHDLLEEGQPVHARHLDVQRDDIRDLLSDPFGSHKGIASRGDHLDLRVGLEYFAQRLAHYSGVVHNQNANFWSAHRPDLVALIDSYRHSQLGRQSA